MRLLALSAALGMLAVAAGPRTQEPPPPSACIEHHGEAVYRNYGYDHLVHLDSHCERAAACVVRTNANPDPIAADVPAGEAVTVLTFRGSPAYDFTHTLSCELLGR